MTLWADRLPATTGTAPDSRDLQSVWCQSFDHHVPSWVTASLRRVTSSNDGRPPRPRSLSLVSTMTASAGGLQR